MEGVVLKGASAETAGSAAGFPLREEEPLDAGKAWESGAGAVAYGAARGDGGFAGYEDSFCGDLTLPVLLDDVGVGLGPARGGHEGEGISAHAAAKNAIVFLVVVGHADFQGDGGLGEESGGEAWRWVEGEDGGGHMDHLPMGELVPVVRLVRRIAGGVEDSGALGSFGLGHGGEKDEGLCGEVGQNSDDRFVDNRSVELDEGVEDGLHGVEALLMFRGAGDVVATSVVLLGRARFIVFGERDEDGEFVRVGVFCGEVRAPGNHAGIAAAQPMVDVVGSGLSWGGLGVSDQGCEEEDQQAERALHLRAILYRSSGLTTAPVVMRSCLNTVFAS